MQSNIGYAVVGTHSIFKLLKIEWGVVPKTSTAIHALPYLQAPKFLAKANARMLAVLILFNDCNRISDKKKKSIMVNRFRSKTGKES